MDNTELVEVQFNEEQKAAMARALMAVAEEMTSKPSQRPPLKHGDVIEVLSDSDSGSECEFLGLLAAAEDECKSEQLKPVPLEMSVQIKQEFEANDALQVYNRNAGRSNEEFRISHLATDKQLSAPECSPSNANLVKLETEALQLPVVKVECNVEVKPLDIHLDKPSVTTTAASSASTDYNVIGDVVSLASTLNSDKVEWSFDNMEDDIINDFMMLSNTDDACDDNDASNADADEIESVLQDDDNSRDPDYQPESDNVDIDDTITLSDSGDDEARTTSLNENIRDAIEKLIYYYCPECGKDCGDLYVWKNHTDKEHRFSSIAKLNLQTIIAREGELCYQCKLCQKKFKTSSRFFTLLSHRILAHMPFADYLKCRLCCKRMTSRIGILRHLRQVHKKIHESTIQGMVQNYHEHIEMHCPVCDAILANYKRWRKHLDTQHQYFDQTSNSVRLVRGNVLACNKCDREFLVSSKERHLLIHEKYHGFHCKLCEYSSNNLVRCNTHVRKIHMGKGKFAYRCSYCAKKLTTSKVRDRHMMESHSFEKPSCQMCGAEFMSIALLVSHMNVKNHHKLK